MSGAAVFSNGRIVGILSRHYRSDGLGRLTASRAGRWRTQVSPARLHDVESLLGISLESLRPGWTGGCPYRGLLPYDPAHAAVFYGRELMTAELAEMLARTGIVVVTGPSGAGKTSVLQAGLVPVLDRGEPLPGSSSWPRIAMTPTAHPLAELAAQLGALGGKDSAAIRDSLAAAPADAHLVIREILLAAARRGEVTGVDDLERLVLIIDQFEQVFDLAGEGGERERAAFIEAVCAAATQPAGPRSEPSALAVIAVRGDYWDRCAAYPLLVSAMQRGQFIVGPMDEADLRRAITGPADESGLRVETSLTDAVLSELRREGSEQGTGALPLLSQAMMLTWEKREGDLLTSRGYGSTGGVAHAVNISAEAAYEGLPDVGQVIARDVLRRMTAVSTDGRITRRPVRLDDLRTGRAEGEREQVDAVLEAFARMRLLVLDADRAEIAHDILLQAWPRLKGWLEEDQTNAILHTQLGEDAAAWSGNGKDASFLYGGTQLAAVRRAVRQWSADPGRYPVLSGTEEDFLRASEYAASARARLRTIGIAALAVLTLVASVASVLAFRQSADARRQRDQAIYNQTIADYNQTIAEALQLGTVNTSLAAQLELSAYRIRATPDATSRLINFENTPLPTPLAGLPAPVDSVACSPDRHVLASGNSDGTVQLWDVSSPAHPQPLGPRFTAATGAVYAVAFSPSGPILATGSGDGAVRLWDVSDPAHLVLIGQPYIGSASYVLSVSFSRNGRMLASGGKDGTIHLWDVTSPARPRPLGSSVNATTGPVSSVAFSRDGRTLASGSGDGTVRLWDVADPSAMTLLGQPLTGSGAAVASVAFSPDGRTLAGGSSDGAIRLWDVTTPGNARLLGPSLTASTGTVDSVAFSADGLMLASGGSDGAVRLSDMANAAAPQSLGPALTGPGAAASSVAFTPDGRTLAVGSADHSIWLWNLPQTILIGHTAAVDAVAFSPDGRTLASGSADQTTRLWNVTNPADPKPLGLPLTGPTGTVDSVAFSPGGRTLATGNFDGTVRLWNVTDPAHPHPLGPPVADTGGNVLSLAFSRDGRTLAVGGSNDKALLWDVTDLATPRQLGQQLAAHDSVAAVAFSPDGQVLAGGSYDRMVWLWDVAEPPHGRSLASSLDAGFAGYVLSVAFSPDGRLLAGGSIDGTVRLWDVTHPADLRALGSPLAGPTGPINSVAFSRDSRLLAIGSGDGTIRLWNVSDPAHPVSAGPPLTGSGAAVMSLAFSPDGKTLASASSDGTIRLWNISVAYAAQRICAVADNALTPALWHQYLLPQLPYQPPCPASAMKVPAAPPALAAGPVPETPGDVAATVTGPRTITVTWAEPSRDVTGYNVDNGCPVSPSYTCGGTDASVAKTTGSTRSAEFSVTPGAYDCFHVQAFNKYGASGWSTYTANSCAETPPLTVTGTREWTDTGVNLSPGARLFIKAIGQIYINPAAPEGPEGDPACEPIVMYPVVSAAFPAPTLPCWSLVGRIGNGPPFEIGSSTLVIATSGRLYLGINDNRLTNNSGSWLVFMKIGGPVIIGPP